MIGIAGELNIDFKAGRIETQLREANTNLVLLLEGRANDAETAAKNAVASAAKLGDLEAKLQRETVQDELLLNAEVNRRRFVPLVFNSLFDERPATVVGVNCFGNNGCSFARTLAAALEKGFKWKVIGPPIGSDIPTESGVIIRNKWIDRPNPAEGRYIAPGDANWSELEEEVRRSDPGIPKSQRDRLLKLSVALHAKLSKDPRLAGDSIGIFVGGPE